jgi:aminopeptidase N
VQLLRQVSRGFELWTSFHLPGDQGPIRRALIDSVASKIDVTLDKKGKLSGYAEIEFTSLADGARVLYVRLASALRVSKIIANGGAELKFIQEDRKKDADLWVILPKPLAKDEKSTWKIEYAGDDVVESAGGGNFYVGNRTNWYPKLDVPGDPFTDRQVYQLRLQSPKDFTLVATGKLIKRSTEGKIEISEWNTETPYTVVGFNYGKFKTKSVNEKGTELTVYANESLNDELKEMQMIANDPNAASLGISGAISTTGMVNTALTETLNSVRVYTHFFGALPYPAISVTQQPSSSFGQSWPTLVFMPYIAFLDATVRNQWGISHDKSTRQFLEQVGPHETAHQWWGHLVGTKTYHDEWLSEGFAEYSAGLYLHVAGGDDKFRAYLEGEKESITAPLNNTSTRAYVAGPIWLGRRLSTDKYPGAYQRLVYAKGAYVLHMLRMMTYNFATRDDSRFIAMMRDFVDSYRHREASTEDFKAIVEKHFGMDMSWFFNQWVYGSELPALTVQYSLTPNEKGVLFHGVVAQRGVSKGFRTVLPVMIFAGKNAGSGRLTIEGESTPFSVQLNVPADRVEFNPLNAVLCDLEVKKVSN